MGFFYIKFYSSIIWCFTSFLKTWFDTVLFE